MSSLVVHRDHIDFLVAAVDTYMIRKSNIAIFYGSPTRSLDLRGTSLHELGTLLWETNVAGVEAEYGGTIEQGTREQVDAYKFRPWMGLPALAPVQILKAIQFYNYQSASAPEWSAGPVKALMTYLQTAAVVALPGYDDALWGVQRS